MQKRLKSMLGIVQSLAFLGVLLAPLTSTSHPLKLSASLIEFDPEAKTLRMECKVFRDDFERSLDSFLKGIDPNTIITKRSSVSNGKICIHMQVPITTG